MKHTSYISSLVYALASASMFIFSSCSDEELESHRGSPFMEEFPLEGARSYFESEAETLQSRSLQSSDTLPLSSGDFTPRWSRPVPSRKNGTCRYDIPLDVTYRYTAVRLERRNRMLYAREVSVYQRLVLVKDTRNNLIGQYVLSLIPEKRYIN